MLAIFSGKVIAWCKEFAPYLRWSDMEVPANLDAHLVLGNYVTQEHSTAKRWLTERPR